MNEELERTREGIARASKEDIEEIIIAALKLEGAMYANKVTNELFRLRKSLEGVWGHDLPTLFEDE